MSSSSMGVAGGDQAIEQRSPERGEQCVGVGVRWQLAAIDRLVDGRDCASGSPVSALAIK
jgi:hypothetical protein